jgi:hypothetical protein
MAKSRRSHDKAAKTQFTNPNMKHILALLAALLFTLAALNAADAPIPPNRYVPLYGQIFTNNEATAAKRGAFDKLCLADVAVRLAEGTGRVEYREKAAAHFASALREVASKPSDFHTLRSIALAVQPLRQGCLIIRDQWTAGKSQPKWTAGQLWQFYAMKEQGKDWFCSEDDGAFNVPDGHGHTKPVTRQMLVKFATDASTRTFVEQIDQPYSAPNPKKRPQDKFFTTGSKRVVSAGADSSFTLVVVPHEPSQSAKFIADGIAFNEQRDGVEITFGRPAASQPVRVVVHRDGRWDVVRSP